MFGAPERLPALGARNNFHYTEPEKKNGRTYVNFYSLKNIWLAIL
jgi:hypothetical protein